MSTGQNAISPNEDMIVVEIEIAAPPERVFRALTDPRQLLLWWTGCNHWELGFAPAPSGALPAATRCGVGD